MKITKKDETITLEVTQEQLVELWKGISLKQSQDITEGRSIALWDRTLAMDMYQELAKAL